MSDTIRVSIESARETGKLFLDEEALEAIPDEVRGLTNLVHLHITGCGLSVLPDWLSELTALTHIDLASNPITELPATLGSLPSLKNLGLSGTRIGKLDDSLRGLRSLEALVVPDTGMHTIPAWIGELEQLTMLDLGRSSIASLPRAFSRLTNLTHLYLWGSELSEIPGALRSLRCLKVLDLSQGGRHSTPDILDRYMESPAALNRTVGVGYDENGLLSKIPAWLSESLPDLRVLSLSGHRLRSLPKELPPKLTVLILSDNDIAAFPSAVLGCDRLEALDIHENVLSSIPSEIESLVRLRYLDVSENHLTIPPEVLAEATSPLAIFDFLRRMHGPTRQLNQAKLLVVGEGSVGKTSLIKRLVSDDFSEHEQKTDGIQVSRWGIDVNDEEILLNVWDFGGQEIMHATHQFFLTKRSLYVLVIDARQGEEQNRLEYWLKLIQSFAGNSPVVIVANKTEESMMDVDARGLASKYPNIVGILPASCKTGAGIDEIADVLERSIEQMPHVRDLLPAAFFEVKRELEQLDANYLAYSDYEQLCDKFGVDGAQAQERLVGFLHDLGTVLCFRDDPRLSDTNILNPDWVTSGVYRLLNSHVAAQRKGLLGWRDVESILSSAAYPAERRPFIVDMMKRFELCYESEGTFLIPDLLTKQEPDTGAWDDALRFEIGYDVLPSSIISRLIVRMHPSISKGTVWRTGVVVAIDRNRGLVKGDREDATLRIAIDGPPNGRRGLLTAIRTELRGIAQTIPGLVGEERVPVPGHPGVWVPYAHLVDLENAEREFVIPQGVTDEFPVSELLAGVESPKDRSDVRVGMAVPLGSDSASLSLVEGPATPWTPTEAMRLGWWLLAALVVLVAVFVGAALVLGVAAAAGVTAAALAAIVGIGSLVLRSSGRLSEHGLLEVFKSVTSRE